jgi:hypothetical protein
MLPNFHQKILVPYAVVYTCLDMHRIFPEGKSYVMREQKSIFEAVHLVSNSTEFRRLKSPMSAPPVTCSLISPSKSLTNLGPVLLW